MDTLHNVMRSISGERKAGPRRDHLTVFREFLDHLDRASRRRPSRSKATKGTRGGGSPAKRVGGGVQDFDAIKLLKFADV